MEIMNKVKEFVTEHAVTIGCCAATAVITYMVTRPSTVETVVAAKNPPKPLTKKEAKKQAKKAKKEAKKAKKQKTAQEFIEGKIDENK